MTTTFNDSHYDALICWAFEPPPLGRDGPSVAAVRFNRPDQPPEIMFDGTTYPVIGTTRSGWLSVIGLGWFRFAGDPDTLSAIGKACGPAQSQMLNDRRRFNAALHRYMARPDDGLCAGLPEIDLGGGRLAIRPEDIGPPEVKRAFRQFLDDLGPDLDGRLVGDLRVRAMPVGYIDSTLWWWFCRTWVPGGP